LLHPRGEKCGLALRSLLAIDTTQNSRPPRDFSSVVVGFILLMVLIYVAKRAILCRVSPAREVMWFVLVQLSTLPYIWLFVVVECFNRQVSPLACCVAAAILIWTIPTVTFVRDRLNADEPLSADQYVVRSVFEVVVLFPYWLLIWVECCNALVTTGWFARAFPF
jgi:hypothetical protein